MLAPGRRFTVHWQAARGSIHVDMHGEPPIADPDTVTRIRLGAADAGDGVLFRAPFERRHGWCWEIHGARPVNVRVRTAGCYEKLSMPRGARGPLRGRHRKHRPLPPVIGGTR